MPLHEFPQKLQDRLLVACLRDERLEHLPFVVHRAPEVVLHPVHLREHLVEVPAPAGGAQALGALPPYLGREWPAR